ncbi:MAG: hypothetical protein ACKO8I_04845 [Cyanobacteriota bacterium]
MAVTTFNLQNLRGQCLLFRCLETGFVTTAPALTRYPTRAVASTPTAGSWWVNGPSNGAGAAR